VGDGVSADERGELCTRCHPESRRKDFAIVQMKLYRSWKGVWGVGLKMFPDARASDYGL
jgi:hypothetical protein